jgi:four helix bundle protein
MDQSKSNQFNEQIRERTMKMAVNVRNLLSSVRVSAIDRPTVNQLIRSSTSVAANYRSATCARSDAEFLSKISIVYEESDESKFWVEYLLLIKVLREQDCVGIMKEMDELVRIFSSIRKKMKEKIERGASGRK